MFTILGGGFRARLVQEGRLVGAGFAVSVGYAPRYLPRMPAET